MLYRTRYIVDGYHKPSESYFPLMWGEYNVRAVSIRHAMNKALRVVCAMPGYADRANHEDWTVTATVTNIVLAEAQ
jgi:hypothetical protein